jgi:SH3-like domain-containing protein
MRLTFGLCVALAGAMALPTTPLIAAPVTETENGATGSTGAAVPRFASLAADDVALRRGPGFDYPILWKYARRGLPVKIIREFGEWRRVSDMDGIEGWMHTKMLSSQRSAIVIGTTRVMFQQPDTGSKPQWRAQVGVTGRIMICQEAWCQLNIDGKTGYIMRTHIWGTETNENFN